jgi:hypothetical protein
MQSSPTRAARLARAGRRHSAAIALAVAITICPPAYILAGGPAVGTIATYF